jgi:hypothetical protein
MHRWSQLTCSLAVSAKSIEEHYITAAGVCPAENTTTGGRREEMGAYLKAKNAVLAAIGSARGCRALSCPRASRQAL